MYRVSKTNAAVPGIVTKNTYLVLSLSYLYIFRACLSVCLSSLAFLDFLKNASQYVSGWVRTLREVMWGGEDIEGGHSGWVRT